MKRIPKNLDEFFEVAMKVTFALACGIIISFLAALAVLAWKVVLA